VTAVNPTLILFPFLIRLESVLTDKAIWIGNLDNISNCRQILVLLIQGLVIRKMGKEFLGYRNRRLVFFSHILKLLYFLNDTFWFQGVENIHQIFLIRIHIWRIVRKVFEN
jgi:hypothetical protein